MLDFYVLEFIFKSLDTFIFILELDGHILELHFQILNFFIDVVFIGLSDQESGKSGKNGMFYMSLVPIMDDSDHPQLFIRLHELSVADHSVEPFLFVCFDEGLHLSAELKISTIEIGANHGVVLTC